MDAADPSAIRAALTSLRFFLPGVSAHALLHAEPTAALIAVDRVALQRRIVDIRLGVGCYIAPMHFTAAVHNFPRLLPPDRGPNR